MLFPPHSLTVQRQQIIQDFQDKKVGQAETAERLLALDPDYVMGYLLRAEFLAGEGKLEEANGFYWSALEYAPCGPMAYFSLTDSLERAGERSSQEVTVLAVWQVALGEEIPDWFAERFRQDLPDAKLDFQDPTVFEVIAAGLERKLEDSDPPYEFLPRLKPYHLLKDIQYEAPEGLAEDTLDAVLAEPAVHLPVLQAALRQWARMPDHVSFDTVAIVTALLGEIARPDALEDLLELITYNDWVLVLHASWAVWRLGQRFPVETLAALRRAAGTINLIGRCGIAEQLVLLPKDVPGIEKVAMELLKDFTAIAKEEDAPVLLMAVSEALRRHGFKREARDVLARYEDLLPKKSRRWMRQTLESEEGYVPHLEYAGTPDLDIDGVAMERALFDDEEEDIEEEEDDEEDPDAPPAIRPGRNEPCWCGSGQKYKKCHLESDERRLQEERTEPAESDRLVAKLLGDILDSSHDWHNLSDIASAHRLYFDHEPSETDMKEMEESGFLEWYVMSFRAPSTGRTLVEEYLRRRGPRLPERDRKLAESWRDLRFAIWEVQRIEENIGVEVKDLFEEGPVFVYDVASSHDLVQWDCVIGRIHFFEDRWLFAGNGFTVPRPLLGNVKELVDEGARTAQSPSEWVRANSHIWWRTLNRMHKEMRKNLRIVNAEGNALEFCHAVYELLDADAAADGLRSAKVFEDTTSKDDAPNVVRFGWHETGGNRAYGFIELRGGKLRLECNSRERLAIGRQLVEKHAGAFLKHVEDECRSVEEAMQAPREEAAVQPAELREIEQKLKEEHYATWPDIALPALGGQTPREAARSATGRRALEDLLRDLENSDTAFDFRTLRQELGL